MKVKVSNEIKEGVMKNKLKIFIEKYTYMKVGKIFMSVEDTIHNYYLFPKATLNFYSCNNSIVISFNYSKPQKIFLDLMTKFEREHKIKIIIRKDKDGSCYSLVHHRMKIKYFKEEYLKWGM